MAALLEGIGSGAVSNPVMDVLQADVVLLIGANPVVNHPVAATWIKNAVKRGTRLILADPRRSELARHATHYLQFKPDTDVALLNAMMHVIVHEGLVDAKFIAERTDGYEALRKNVEGFSPEAMAPLCGVPAETIREVARLYATSKGSMILWGMGISQHVHGTDNARCLIALSLMTGQIGRPGTGLHPLRGQNNVQGASDSGLIPMMYPDYQRVSDRRRPRKIRAALGHARSTTSRASRWSRSWMPCIAARSPGCTSWARTRRCPIPTSQHARAALADLEWLVVQDIFLTETAYLADVILPASAFPEKTGTFTNTDRLVQLGRQALSPPGEARQDLELDPGDRAPHGARLELRGPARRVERNAQGDAVDRRHHVGAPRSRIGRHLSVRARRRSRATASCSPRISRPPPGSRASFRPTSSPRRSSPTHDYPMVLITGRQLEHWHTGSMTRRTAVLDAIEPEPVASMNPLDLAGLCA